jgi:alkylated DNA repair dioxygenase AlkB
MFAQNSLFELNERALPPGMRYCEQIISEGQERSLVRFIEALPLRPFEFVGGFKGNRRVMSFGLRYDYDKRALIEAAPIPNALDVVRQAAASFAGQRANELIQALVTEYSPGAGIGWHRDKRMFGDVIGISLLTPCVFRLRLKKSTGWERISVETEPRSAYLLSGASRNVWEHSIPPLKQLRYSITFRTLAK